jgi:AcrR family transcriptional regulator
VEAILESARELLVVEGIAALSIDALAERADVAIGTIYQFFASKEAVLNELARQSIEAAGALFNDLRSPPVSARAWSERLSMFLDRMADAWRGDASAQVIWDPAWMTPEMRTAAANLHVDLSGLVEDILADAGVPRRRRPTMAVVVVESSAAVLEWWIAESSETGEMRREVIRMLDAYIRDAIAT